MKGDLHVRFCENAGVKLPCVTRLAVIVNKILPMTKSTVIILLTMTMISCGRTQKIEDLKKKYIFDDLNIYIENPLPTDNNPDRYSIDNKAYKINRKFIFDYYIIKGSDTLKIVAPK